MQHTSGAPVQCSSSTAHQHLDFALQVHAARSWHSEDAPTLILVQQDPTTTAMQEKPLVPAEHAALVLFQLVLVRISVDSASETVFWPFLADLLGLYCV